MPYSLPSPFLLWTNGRYLCDENFFGEQCRFAEKLFHPNVFPCGSICLSLIDDTKGWTAAVSIKALLIGIRDLLDAPNNSDAAQEKAYRIYKSDKALYKRMVREQAARLAPAI